MGTSYSSIPECGINRRALLNTSNAESILRKCSADRVSYTWGIIFVLTTLLIVGHLMTRQYEHEEDYPRKNFYVPIWIPTLPVMFGLLYSMTTWRENKKSFVAEEVEFKLSDMSKKDYLHYKSGDDRTATSFAATGMSAGILAATGVFGPYLRADR